MTVKVTLHLSPITPTNCSQLLETRATAGRPSHEWISPKCVHYARFAINHVM